MRRTAILAAALCALAAPAWAKDEEPKAPEGFPLEAVALPVVVDGQLINYVFVSIRLELTAAAEVAKVRAKEQYFRDDLVRAGHRTPFTRADDYTRMDETKIRAEILRAAPALVGSGMIKTVIITKQISQKLLTLPAPRKARAAEVAP